MAWLAIIAAVVAFFVVWDLTEPIRERRRIKRQMERYKDWRP